MSLDFLFAEFSFMTLVLPGTTSFLNLSTTLQAQFVKSALRKFQHL